MLRLHFEQALGRHANTKKLIKVFTHNIKKYNLEALVKSTDILFICRSIPWVPREEQQLYETWKDLIDFLYKK